MKISAKMPSIRIFLFVVFTTFVSACGGGGGGSSDSSSATTATSGSIDAQGREVVAALLSFDTSSSSNVSGAISSTPSFLQNGRITYPSISPSGVTMHFDNETVAASFGGTITKNGDLVTTYSGNNVTITDLELFETWALVTNESFTWAFDGTVGEHWRVQATLSGGGTGFTAPGTVLGINMNIGDPTTSLTATNSDGDVYIFDEIFLDYTFDLSSPPTISTPKVCTGDFIKLHKQGSGTFMRCNLASDCSGCL